MSTASGVGELSQAGLDVLMTAVRVARDEQIRTVAALKARLSGLFPGQDSAIHEALVTWAEYEKSKRHD